MKTKKCLTLLLFSLSTTVFAGDKGGNGGGGYLCYTDSTKTVEKSVVSYDLWEGARFHKNWKIAGYDGREKKQDILNRIVLKIQKTQPNTAAAIQKNLDKLNDPNFINDSADIELLQIPDVDQLVVGKNCKYVQMVNWLNENHRYLGSPEMILRNEMLYSLGPVSMDPLNQAALDLHEAAYKLYRDSSAREFSYNGFKSNKVREFVAEAFSDQPSRVPLMDNASMHGVYIYDEELGRFRVSFSFNEAVKVEKRNNDIPRSATRSTVNKKDWYYIDGSECVSIYNLRNELVQYICAKDMEKKKSILVEIKIGSY